MIIEYICPDCQIRELDFHIIPLKKCPKCKQLMNANELE